MFVTLIHSGFQDVNFVVPELGLRLTAGKPKGQRGPWKVSILRRKLICQLSNLQGVVKLPGCIYVVHNDYIN